MDTNYEENINESSGWLRDCKWINVSLERNQRTISVIQVYAPTAKIKEEKYKKLLLANFYGIKILLESQVSMLKSERSWK